MPDQSRPGVRTVFRERITAMLLERKGSMRPFGTIVDSQLKQFCRLALLL